MDHVAMMRSAKAHLSNNWLNAAIGTLVYTAIIGLAGFTYVGEIILAGPLALGYVLFVAGIVDTRNADFNLLFKGFYRFVDTMVAGLLVSIIVGVALCLLIVPGIIASMGLSMVYFIMMDDPNINGVDAIKASWNMMNGHKMDFFILNLRFIGWILLACLTCGIGLLWLQPYMYTTYLNYYRQLRYGAY